MFKKREREKKERKRESESERKRRRRNRLVNGLDLGPRNGPVGRPVNTRAAVTVLNIRAHRGVIRRRSRKNRIERETIASERCDVSEEFCVSSRREEIGAMFGSLWYRLKPTIHLIRHGATLESIKFGAKRFLEFLIFLIFSPRFICFLNVSKER
uniref:Uncharacterized protein n=1 Tax=Cacopsylla melanoneura TaxID=428564 RepID=A0A8D8M714_9HEMI